MSPFPHGVLLGRCLPANQSSPATAFNALCGLYGFPIEQKMFDLYVRATGQAQGGDALTKA